MLFIQPAFPPASVQSPTNPQQNGTAVVATSHAPNPTFHVKKITIAFLLSFLRVIGTVAFFPMANPMTMIPPIGTVLTILNSGANTDIKDLPWLLTRAHR